MKLLVILGAMVWLALPVSAEAYSDSQLRWRVSSLESEVRNLNSDLGILDSDVRDVTSWQRDHGHKCGHHRGRHAKHKQKMQTKRARARFVLGTLTLLSLYGNKLSATDKNELATLAKQLINNNVDKIDIDKEDKYKFLKTLRKVAPSL